MRQSIIFRGIIFLFIFFHACGAAAENPDYFPGALYGTDGSSLYIIDKNTGKSKWIGPHGDLDGTSLNALAFNSDGELYGISQSIGYATTGDIQVEAQLYRISPDTGLAFPVGPLKIGEVFEGGLCFDGEDNLFGANQGDASSAGLFKINPATGAATIIGLREDHQARDINGLAFDGSTLYAVERKTNTVGTVDKVTGVYLPVGRPGFFVGSLGGLALDPEDGTLYAALGSGRFFCRIDKATGEATYIGLSLSRAMKGLTFSPPSDSFVWFYAEARSNSVILKWETESEAGTAGFNIYRAKGLRGEYLPVNDELIPAKGSSEEGSAYELVDDDVQNRRRYYYTLEEVDTDDNSTMYGPVSVVPRWIFGN